MKAEFISVFLHHYSYRDFPRKYLFWALYVNVNNAMVRKQEWGGNFVSNWLATFAKHQHTLSKYVKHTGNVKKAPLNRSSSNRKCQILQEMSNRLHLIHPLLTVLEHVICQKAKRMIRTVFSVDSFLSGQLVRSKKSKEEIDILSFQAQCCRIIWKEQFPEFCSLKTALQLKVRRIPFIPQPHLYNCGCLWILIIGISVALSYRIVIGRNS